MPTLLYKGAVFARVQVSGRCHIRGRQMERRAAIGCCSRRLAPLPANPSAKRRRESELASAKSGLNFQGKEASKGYSRFRARQHPHNKLLKFTPGLQTEQAPIRQFPSSCMRQNAGPASLATTADVGGFGGCPCPAFPSHKPCVACP